MGSANPNESPHLPEEIIEDIILRFPVESLLRFKCVSKPWRSLISSKRFIKIHRQNSTRNTVIVKCNRGIKQCSLQSMLDRSVNPSPFDDPIFNQLNDPIILGCCNGLVCILDVENNRDVHFFLWNPSTRIFKKLPKVDETNRRWRIFNHGLGRDEASDDYKVFAFLLMLDSKEFIGKVYSLKTNSWKTIEHMQFPQNFSESRELVYLPLKREEGVFVGGNLHWKRSKVEQNIACFDLKTEVCGKIELPYNPKYCFGCLCVFGGCLSLVACSVGGPTEIWVMKEYGVNESWSKLITLSHIQELVQRPFSTLFGVGGDGEILLFLGRFFLVYYPQRNEFLKVGRFSQENVYVEV